MVCVPLSCLFFCVPACLRFIQHWCSSMLHFNTNFLSSEVPCVSTRSLLDCAVIRLVPRHRNWYPGVQKSVPIVCSRKLTARFTSSSVTNILRGQNRGQLPAVVPYPVTGLSGSMAPSDCHLFRLWLASDCQQTST